MKVLIVKEDGLIYAAEVPEEPIVNLGPSPDTSDYEIADERREEYERALASAKESAVLVSDQEKAKVWLRKPYEQVHNLIKFPSEIKPGIYPIPDLQWEPRTVEKFYEGKGWFWETVAILKESTPSTDQIIDDINGLVIYQGDEDSPSTEQESQEAIFEVIRYCRRTNLECSAGGYKTMFEYLKKNFTITRKP